MDTAQPLAAENNALGDAAQAFKIATGTQPRDEAGRFAGQSAPVEEQADTVEDEADPQPVAVEEETAPEEAAEEAQPDDVAMPSSWSTEDAETWSALPAEAKAKIAEREAQRDAAVNVKFQEYANLRKTADAERAAAQNSRTEYAAQLDALMGAIQPQPPSVSMLDPNSPDYNPDAYHMGRAKYEHETQALTFLAQQRQAIAAQQQQEEATAFQEYEAQARPKLLEAVPVLADPVKGPVVINEIAQYAVANDVPADRLPDLTSTEVLFLYKAMQFDKQQAASRTVKAVPKPAPPAVKPGVARTQSASANASFQRDIQRLNKSGSVADAAHVFKHFLKA